MNSWLFRGKVFHHRLLPREHQFSNSVFFIRFPLGKTEQLNRSIFSVDRWNILSFHRKDHGFRDGSDLMVWAKTQLQAAGITDEVSEVELQTLPRILGFVFNPVSFWFCYSDGKIVATIAEVNNTFGQSHTYVFPDGNDQQEKVFHVSPFFQIEGSYQFSFKQTVDSSFSSIEYSINGEKYFFANIQGKAIEWTSPNLIRTWLSSPLLTWMVIFFIHWHALLLYLKGVRFFGSKGIKESL